MRYHLHSDAGQTQSFIVSLVSIKADFIVSTTEVNAIIGMTTRIVSLVNLSTDFIVSAKEVAVITIVISFMVSRVISLVNATEVNVIIIVNLMRDQYILGRKYDELNIGCI